MDDLGTIKDWLRKQEVDEPIPQKAQDRVLTQMARGIRHTKPLTGGACSLCSYETERLVPLSLRCCLDCCKGFIKKGGGLKFIERKVGLHTCDNCLNPSIITMVVNPYVCEKCTHKIGKIHNRELIESREREKKLREKINPDSRK